MNIDVITLFPQMFDAIKDYGVSGKAIEKELARINLVNPRDFTTDPRKTVDDRPYGGGPGMVMLVQPLRDAINHAKAQHQKQNDGDSHVIYMSPQGRKLDYAVLKELVTKPNLIFVAGRYEGIDERLIEQDIDEELSIGDYVLTGGELATMVVIDALVRLIPGALGHEDAADQDSFVEGILDCPHYSRPEELETGSTNASTHVSNTEKVPAVLLSGDHAAIKRWRQKQALGNTWMKRPELIEAANLTAEDKNLLDEFISEQK